MKVLVTGVAGFIGSNLADRLLAAGHEVIGIDSLVYGLKEQVPTGVDFHKLDIRSKDIYPVFTGVEVVFHLAAKNDLIACQEDPVETMEVNVAGTTNVFEAARRAGVRKTILASSSALEEGEERRKGFYAISKEACEKAADGYRNAFGLTVVTLRYFNVYGPRQDYRRSHPPVMSAFIMKILKGQTPILYEDEDKNKRDFIYVDDLNDFHLKCLEDARVDNQFFPLGNGKNVSIEEIWDVLKKISGSDLVPKRGQRAPDDKPATTLADISAATAIGWHPKTSLETGLAAQFAYLKGELAK